jgi:hypothetical protein
MASCSIQRFIVWLGLSALCAHVMSNAQTTTEPASQAPAATTTKPAGRPVVIVVSGTLEAAIGRPQVNVQIRDANGRVLLGRPSPLAGRNEPDSWFSAYLDTSAAGIMVCRATADRFSIESEPGIEHGGGGLGRFWQGRYGVSVPYAVGVGASSGSSLELQSPLLQALLRDTRLQLELPHEQQQVAKRGGWDGPEANYFGMGAIRQLLVDMDTTPMLPRDAGHSAGMRLGAGPAVRARLASKLPSVVDVEIPIEFRSFDGLLAPASSQPTAEHQQPAGNTPPSPTFGPLPFIRAIECQHQGATCTGDWLFHTGHTTTIISTRLAKALQLVDDDGKPLRSARPSGPDFTVTLPNLDRDATPKLRNGFIIDKLKLAGKNNQIVEFVNAHVVVMDVSSKTSDGAEFTLDGVFGMNLLLPSVSGTGTGTISGSYRGAFSRIWIDGPNASLGLQWRR